MQALDEAKGIGVGAMQAAIRTHGQRVDCAYALGHSIRLIEPRQSLDLVGQGQIASRKA